MDMPESLSSQENSPARRDAAMVLGACLLALGLAWGLDALELAGRAKASALAGDRWLAWHSDPQAKRAALEAALAAGRLDAEQARFIREDSDLKNAWICYGTAADLYQPPRSAWSRRCEERLEQLRPLYEAWRRRQGLPPAP